MPVLEGYNLRGKQFLEALKNVFKARENFVPLKGKLSPEDRKKLAKPVREKKLKKGEK